MVTSDVSGVPRPAAAELLALAAVARPDWNQDALMAALADAHSRNLSWATVLTRAGALMADRDASPRDLTAAERRDRRPGVQPNPEYERARAQYPSTRTHKELR